MRTTRFIACLLESSPAFSQQPESLLGKWIGFVTSQGGRETAVELVVDGTGGTRRFTLQGAPGRNPCLGRSFPVSVTLHSPTELSFDINGFKGGSGLHPHDCVTEIFGWPESAGKTWRRSWGQADPPMRATLGA